VVRSDPGIHRPSAGLATLEDLDEDALIQILTEPKNALVKQYQRLFEMEDVELTFHESALSEIAKRGIIRKTGARGLRSIMEKILLDTMFELPALEGVREVVISDEVVNGNARPLYIYAERDDEAKDSAAPDQSFMAFERTAVRKRRRFALVRHSTGQSHPSCPPLAFEWRIQEGAQGRMMILPVTQAIPPSLP
jgi:hypothetical protein